MSQSRGGLTRTDPDRSAEIDLSDCDREPIHIPGSIQPHGLLMVLTGDALIVRHVSQNTEPFLRGAPSEIIGRPLAEIIGAETVARLRPGLESPALETDPLCLGPLELGPDRLFLAVAHRHNGSLILELEPSGASSTELPHELHAPLQSFLTRLDAVASVADLAAVAAEEVRRITGFDRVLIYRFDEDDHGTVVAEDRNDRLPALLGLRFPASDIPRQARELYRLSRIRLIVDVNYTPARIEPAADQPIDLTHATLRSVSPVHVEYMRNMGTEASMSISVIRDGRLWGLISCHHAAPRFVPYLVRSACDFLARIFSLQIGDKEHHAEYEHRITLSAVQARLIVALTGHEKFDEGLAAEADDLLRFASSTGAAILFEGHCTRIGDAPPEPDVRRIAEWLSGEVRQDVFATDALSARLPRAASIADRASGLLAVTVSKLHKNFVLWFRPEIVRTVDWAGDPRKPTVDKDLGPSRLSPRSSFEAWREVVRFRSAPWRQTELDAAAGLRNAIIGVVLRKAEELAQLNAELQRTNQELESFSYSVSHDLRAPFRHIAGYAELLRGSQGERLDAEGQRFLKTIIESAMFAGTLVDNLLAFSRMGRTALHLVELDMNALLRETIAKSESDTAGRSIDWRIAPLPPVRGDLMMLRQVLSNLLSNAVKYTRPRETAIIEIAGDEGDEENIYTFRDNGIGFDMKYADKLFGVFQRLHRMEDFEGTGIGLANVRRIVNRHGGKVWAESTVGEGTTFYFSLPRGGPPGQGAYAEADTPRRG